VVTRRFCGYVRNAAAPAAFMFGTSKFRAEHTSAMLSHSFRIISLLAITSAICAGPLALPADAWNDQGHEIIAIIAADNLPPTALRQTARILGSNANVTAVAKAMAAASTQPDNKFKQEDPSTAAWHFIYSCRQDRRRDLPARCPGKACVTAKIEEYAKRLQEGKCDRWHGYGDLAFLIHLMGDIHQPLHTITNADKGGSCIMVNDRLSDENLHEVWDTVMLEKLEHTLHADTAMATAHQLEKLYSAEKDDAWRAHEIDDIAWESHQLAASDIYEALNLPIEPCEPAADSCAHAPTDPINIDSAYMASSDGIVGKQITKAGFRLAALLNHIWPSGSSIHECE
jgi:S1/P1 Nuclease